jgi:outer membrane protein
MINNKFFFILCTFLCYPSIFFSQDQQKDLYDIYLVAIKKDVILRKYMANTEADIVDIQGKKGELYPQVNVKGKEEIREIEKTIIPAYKRHYRTIDLRLDQVILDVNKWETYQQSKSMAMGSIENLKEQRQDLMIRTAQSYFEVLKGLDARDAADKAFNAFETKLQNAKRKIASGVINQSDMADAQAKKDLSESLIIEKTKLLENKKQTLNEILSFPIAQRHFARLPQEIRPPQLIYPASVSKWLAIASRYSPILKEAYYKKITAQKALYATQGNLVPTIGFYAKLRGGNDENITLENSPTRKFLHSFQMGLDFSDPNLNPYQTLSQSEKMRDEFHQSDIDIEKKRRQINHVVQFYFSKAQGSIKKIEALKSALEAQKQSLEGIGKGLDAGRRTNWELLDQVTKTYDAEIAYRTAYYDYFMSVLWLKRACGILTPKDLKTISVLWLDQAEPFKKTTVNQ